MDRIKITAYFHAKKLDPKTDSVDANPFPITDSILNEFGTGTLNLVDAYYIHEAQGASGVGGEAWMGRAKVFTAYCSDQAKAIRVKDRIMALADPGVSIGFEMVTVPVFVFTAK